MKPFFPQLRKVVILGYKSRKLKQYIEYKGRIFTEGKQFFLKQEDDGLCSDSR